MGTPTLKKVQYFLIAIAATLSSTAHAHAALLFDRGLPITNINNTAPTNPAPDADRSNISWGFADRIGSGTSYSVGDDFSVGAQGSAYVIDTLRVWVVIGVSGTNTTIPNTFWETFTLWGGRSSSGASGLQSITSGQTDGSNGNIQITQVNYANGENYWAETPRLYRKIWQVDFTGLNWLVNGGERYQFFVDGTGFTSSDTWNVFPVLHASNASLSGSPQAGADNFYWLARIRNGTPDFVGSWNSDQNSAQNGNGGTFTQNGLLGFGGWNKSSDINVQVFGSAAPQDVPEVSSTSSMLALGLLGVATLLFKPKQRL